MIQIKLTKCFFYTNKAHEIVTIISILVQEKVSIILSFKLLKKKKTQCLQKLLRQQDYHGTGRLAAQSTYGKETFLV